MKITTFILIMTLMQVSAATFGQNFTLREKNVSIARVFFEIRKQTGYDVLLETSKLKTSQKINAEFNNIPVKEVIDQIIKGTELEYSFNDKTIFIKQKEKSLFERVVDRFQAIDVRGRVVDENSQPLVGATVKIKGTNITVSSDAGGVFSLNNVDDGAILQISFLGYKTKEVKAATQVGEIKMELGSSDLEEIIISTGYFSTTKAKSTINITKVDGDEIQNQPVTALINSLIGRTSGLDITPTSNVPGSPPTIRIRGQNSLSQRGSYPLYILDGIQIESSALGRFDPLAGISPANIESIEVLKDAGATAIYGTRGANGVIRITTKQAKMGLDKTNFDFNVYTGIGEMANRVDLLNTEQYLQMRHEAYANDGAPPDIFSSVDFLVWDTTRTTDWQDVLLGGTANITDIQGSFSGGNQQTSFKIGGGFHKETTIYTGNDSFKRLTADVSFYHNSKDGKLRISAGTNFGWTTRRSYNSSDLLSSALTLPPMAPKLYNDDGTLNWEYYAYFPDYTGETWTNPLAGLSRRMDNTSLSILGNAVFTYQILPDLRFKTTLAISSIANTDEGRFPISSLFPSSRPYSTASMTFADNSIKSYMAEPQLIFEKNINKHHLNAIVGTTFRHNQNIDKSIEGRDYPSDALLGSLYGAKSYFIRLDEKSQYKYASLYGHISYDYQNKYLINLTGRRDGSSRFGPGKQYGNFGAISAGWIFSEEEFFKKNFKLLSFGKIRGSLGITGNDQIGDYKYLDFYSVITPGYQDGISLTPLALFNPDYAWERTKKMEVGIELGLLKNRIMIDASLYKHLSSNQLINYPLSAATGFQSILANFDAVVQNTGFEAGITTKNFINKNFIWTTNFNLSIPRNKLIKFDGIETSPYASTYKIGEPLNILSLYNYLGVNSTTGLYQVEDVNNDGLYDSKDKKFSRALGRSSYYGLINTFKFKSIDLSFLMQFSNNPIAFWMPTDPPGSSYNQNPEVLNRWQKPGDNAVFQKFTPFATAEYELARESNRNIRDASFIRLKTLSLGWTFPESFIKSLKLKGSRLYIQGQNLFTITNFTGLDPETGSQMPPLRILSAGLQINF